MSYVTHARAQFTPAGRLKLVRLVLDDGWAQARIAEWSQCTRSTVSKWVARYRMPLLGHLDRTTGLPVRKPKPVRYEREKPGDLVHVDVKKLDRIPDGGGHRTRGRQAGRKNRTGVGYSYLHSAIDDHSRLALVPVLHDPRRAGQPQVH